METVKIVFDIDSKDVKTTTDELKALNKVTNEEVASLDKLSQSAEDAGDGFVSLRTQVKQAKEEAQKAAEKYGEFSKEANAARVKAGALADQMGDLNRQVGLLNPEAKAKAFSNLAQGVVGAFAVATGALQAFGVKNKEVEELAMKLQGALNITQGIASFGALKESLQDVKVVLGFTTAAQEGLTVAKETDIVVTEGATVANKTFIASLATNPIFLVVAAIGALAAAYITLNEQTKSAILNEQELADAKKKTTELKNKELQTEIDLKVANKEISKQEGERRKIEAKRLEDTKELKKRIADLNKEELRNNETIKNRKILAEEVKKSNDRETAGLRSNALEAIKNAELANQKIAQSRKVLQEQLITIDKTASNEKVQQDIDEKNELSSNQEKANKEAEAKRAAALAKQKQLSNEQKAAREKQYNEELALRKAQQQGVIDGLKTEEEKIAKQREFNQENLTFSKSYYEEVGRSANEIALLEQNFANDQAALLNKEVKLRTDKNAKVLEAEKKLQKALLDLALAGENDPLKRAQLVNDAREKEIDDQLALVEKGSKEEQILIAEKATAEIEAQKRIADAQKQAQAQDDKNKQEQKKSDEQAAQDRIATAQFVFNAVSQLSNSLAELQKAQTDQEIADLQAQYDKKLINEKTYNAKLRELKRKQWEADKRARIIEATMGIAQGIINALGVQPPNLVPYAIGLAGTVGALNLATIIAQKPPQFAKGTLSVPGIDMGRDSVHAILQPGEAVIPTKTNKAYHPTIKAIYEKKISPSEINNFVMSRTSSGGSSSIKASVDTYALTRALSKNKTVEVGNANIIGRAMAKELLRGQNLRRS